MMEEKDKIICDFNIVINPKTFYISQPRPKKLYIYRDYLVIKQKPPIKISLEDIKFIKLSKQGIVVLNYSDEKLEFEISSITRGITDAATDLFIALVNGLKKKVDISWITESIRQIKQKKSKLSKFIKFLIVLVILLGIVSFIFLGNNRDAMGAIFGFSALACLVLIIPLAIIRSLEDYKLHNKLTVKIPYHYIMADTYLKILETTSEDISEEVKNFAHDKAMRHLERIIELDSSSEYVDELRKRLFP